MKKLFLTIILSVCCMLAINLQAQNYTPQVLQAEYYWGTTDPGAGNGTALLAQDGSLSDAIEGLMRSGINVPAGGLNVLNVRILGFDGAWGPVFKSVVNADAAFTSDLKVTLFEYYIDTDNGAGSNTALVALAGNFNDAVEAALKSAINSGAVGLHTLGVRVQGVDGAWGPVFKSIFNVDANFTSDLKVTLFEYYIDTDNGAGSNTALIALDGNFDNAVEAAFKSGIAAPAVGLHTLGVRVQGVDGAWGPVFKAIFNVDADFTSDLKITQGEFFIDTDPGAGSAAALLAFDGNYNDAIEDALNNNIAAPAVGLHTINARFKGVDGAWGPIFKLVFNVDAQFTSDLKVIAAEYYFDTDPGAGSATPMVALDGSFNNAIEVAISSAATGALTQGNHVLSVRVKGVDNAWGPVFSLVVIVDPCTPSPSASITSGGPTTICPADSVILTGSAGNGYTYQWRKDGANIPGANSQTYAANASGAYTVAITNTGGCTAISNTINVTVAGSGSPDVTITASPSTAVCAGAPVTFTATSTNQGTNPVYQWRVNGNNVGTNSNQLVLSNLNNNDVVTAILTSNAVCVFPLNDTSNAITASIIPAPSATVNASGTTTLCPGQSVSLSALPGYTYLWSTNATTQSINVSTAGTYTVIVTSGNCTAASSATVVTLNNAPSAAITPATASVCSGGSTTLTASGGTSYAWSNSLGSNATVTVFPTSATTYTVTVTGANSCSATASRLVNVSANSAGSFSASICQGQSYLFNGINRTTQGAYLDTLTSSSGCDSIVTLNLTVNPLPNAAITPATATVCSGSSTQLTASGGMFYLWSNSLGNNATVTVSPTSATTYTVTVTTANNCSATVSRLVNVSSFSTGTINASICQGQSYLFNGINRTTQGAYLDTLVGSTGCDSIVTLNLTVNPLPNAAISPATASVCSGNSATLIASGGGTYTWSNSLGSNAVVTVSPTVATTYTVTVTANNCSATASRLVNVSANSASSFSASICQGQSYLFNGVNRTTAGAYLDTLVNAGGCDSIVTLNLTVNNAPNAAIAPATVTICNGASVQLTASGGTGYAWSNGGNNAITNVSPSTTTTYSVTVTAANNNCSATASRTVTVNQLPLAAINGPSTICAGLSATLTASGGTGYSWSNGLGSSAQITVTPTTNTTYVVTVTNVNNCSATASQTVSVTSAPSASISGNLQVCAGASTTLTANGGNTYQWSNGLGTNAAITVSPTANTTYTVTATVGANCSATATATVIVNQASASQFSQAICAGSGYTFNGQQLTQAGTYTDTLQNANGCDSIVTLTLSLTNGLQSSITGAICQGDVYSFNGANLTAAGVYMDTLQTAAGCDSVVTLTLTVNNLPIPVVIRNADTLTTQTYSSYQWLLNNAPLSNATTQTLTMPVNGNYAVVVTDGNGCSDTSQILSVVNVSVADAVDAYTVAVYPNPNNGNFVVQFSDNIQHTIYLTDALGKLIVDRTVATQTQQINLEDQAAGIYFLHVLHNGSTRSFKISLLK